MQSPMNRYQRTSALTMQELPTFELPDLNESPDNEQNTCTYKTFSI